MDQALEHYRECRNVATALLASHSGGVLQAYFDLRLLTGRSSGAQYVIWRMGRNVQVGDPDNHNIHLEQHLRDPLGAGCY